MRLLYTFVLLILLLGACSTANADTTETLPPGEAANGAALFTQAVDGAPACSTCHTLDETTLVGPGLQGFAAAASARIDGVSAEEYTHTSIVRPAAHIASGFSNTMYNQYAQHLTPQQTADLIAYLLTL